MKKGAKHCLYIPNSDKRWPLLPFVPHVYFHPRIFIFTSEPPTKIPMMPKIAKIKKIIAKTVPVGKNVTPPHVPAANLASVIKKYHE